MTYQDIKVDEADALRRVLSKVTAENEALRAENARLREELAKSGESK